MSIKEVSTVRLGTVHSISVQCNCIIICYRSLFVLVVTGKHKGDKQLLGDELMPMCTPSMVEPMQPALPINELMPICTPSMVDSMQPALPKYNTCRPKRGVRGGRRGYRARNLQSYC